MEKSPDAFRTISEVAEWLDTPAHVLRFWESRFPQIRPVKRAGGRRYYRPADVALLGGIKKLLHEDGITIRGVQKILREMGVRHVAALGPGPAGGPEIETAALAEDDLAGAPPRDEVEVAEAGMTLDAEPAEPAPDERRIIPLAERASRRPAAPRRPPRDEAQLSWLPEDDDEPDLVEPDLPPLAASAPATEPEAAPAQAEMATAEPEPGPIDEPAAELPPPPLAATEAEPAPAGSTAPAEPEPAEAPVGTPASELPPPPAAPPLAAATIAEALATAEQETAAPTAADTAATRRGIASRLRALPELDDADLPAGLGPVAERLAALRARLATPPSRGGRR